MRKDETVQQVNRSSHLVQELPFRTYKEHALRIGKKIMTERYSKEFASEIIQTFEKTDKCALELINERVSPGTDITPEVHVDALNDVASHIFWKDDSIVGYEDLNATYERAIAAVGKLHVDWSKKPQFVEVWERHSINSNPGEEKPIEEVVVVFYLVQLEKLCQLLEHNSRIVFSEEVLDGEGSEASEDFSVN